MNALPQESQLEPVKYCPGCKRYVHKSEFQRNRSNDDGLQSQCSECQCATVQRYRDRQRKAREWAKRQVLQRHRDEVQQLTRERMAVVR